MTAAIVLKGLHGYAIGDGLEGGAGEHQTGARYVNGKGPKVLGQARAQSRPPAIRGLVARAAAERGRVSNVDSRARQQHEQLRCAELAGGLVASTSRNHRLGERHEYDHVGERSEQGQRVAGWHGCAVGGRRIIR